MILAINKMKYTKSKPNNTFKAAAPRVPYQYTKYDIANGLRVGLLAPILGVLLLTHKNLWGLACFAASAYGFWSAAHAKKTLKK